MLIFWDFLTHFCYYFKLWKFFQIFCCNIFKVWGNVIPFFKFLPGPEGLSYARKSCYLKSTFSYLLNFIGNIFELAVLFFVWIKRLLEFFWYLVSTEVYLISISSLIVLLLIFYLTLLLLTGLEIWFCNDWIQSVVRVCQGKFESTYPFFVLFLLDSEIVSRNSFCISFIREYILNIFFIAFSAV